MRGQGHPEDGKQAWSAEGYVCPVGLTLREATTTTRASLGCVSAVAKPWKTLSFMLTASKRQDGQAAAVRSGLKLRAKHQ